MRRLSLLCTLLTTTAVVNAQEGFGGGGFGKPEFCRPYKCSKGDEPVPKWPLRLTSAGCNSGMGGMQIMSAGGGGDKNDPQTPCCDMRQACLQTCGTIKTYCDEEFLKCTKATCAAMDTTAAKEDCEKSAGIHELMVNMDRCQKYDSEQYSHCECVSKDAAPAKREKVLRAFYKKFNPDNVDKVSSLAKKAETPRKMAGLMLKLYKKYPQVIKKIKDPQQEMMDKIMREAQEKKDKEPEKEEEEDDSDAEDLGTDEL